MNSMLRAGNQIVCWLLLTAPVVPLSAQQVADVAFRPPIEKPAYPPGKGPVVLIDEAHDNFHTAAGRYLPFAELLRRDGYVVVPSAAPFTAEALRGARVLAIANATQIFAPDEIVATRAWVSGGGSLLLIADHPPFLAPAAELGKALGIRFFDGSALEPNNRSGRIIFRRSDGSLRDDPLTTHIDQVATFTGSAFQLDVPGHPLLVFGSDAFLWKSETEQNRLPLKGHFQGAVLEFGKGRVAVFGEAAMFSAQLSGPEKNPMGMNAAIAKQNPQLLLNVIHWLTD
jgi:hypothetical protein